MQNASAGGSPLDFLARFAGPIAWLIAGLLLLFGGLPFGGEDFFFRKGWVFRKQTTPGAVGILIGEHLDLIVPILGKFSKTP